jgi:hypothetical protein
MSLAFLSPLAGLIGLAVVLPLAAFALIRRRNRRARGVLGLPAPGRSALLVPAAICLVAALVAVAATQPVLRERRTRHVRTDAEAWILVDESRSMLARQRISSSTRLDRAKALALQLRTALPDVPVGLGSLTDRALPDLFPSADPDVFASTLADSIGIERPPPSEFLRTRVTTLLPLADVHDAGFFAPSAQRRVVVVLTDGESQPFSPEKLAVRLRAAPSVVPVFVHVWHPDERVYSDGRPEEAYRPDPASTALLRSVAAAAGGAAFDESQVGAAARAVRADLGRGPTASIGENRGQTRLAPWFSLAAILPLSFVLWRRNLT